MNKKLIGIPLWNQGENSVGATKPYLEWARQFGSVVILSPDTFIEDLDLLILPGGKDIINSSDNDFSFYNSDGERFLEAFENLSLYKYINNETPIFGICRGFQKLLNHYGANLVQNINWGHGYSKSESDLEAHEIIIEDEDYFKFGMFKSKHKIEIGSWHHQGILVSDCPECFDVIAYSNDFGNRKDSIVNKDHCLIEYAIHKTLPIAGTQSHPERNYFNFDIGLVKYLMSKK